MAFAADVAARHSPSTDARSALWIAADAASGRVYNWAATRLTGGVLSL